MRLNPITVAGFDPNPMSSSRWKNRRKLAFMAIYGIFVVTGLLLSPIVPVDRVKALEGPLEWFYLSMSGIVGAYCGLSTWASIQTNQQLANTETDEGSQPGITT